MLHPSIRRQWISNSKGYGLFATQDIPMGSITYVQDRLDIIFKEGDPLLSDPRYEPLIQRYSFIDSHGDLVLSWDDARYMNHCCHANTLTTGFGFEIAIRKIEAGEEVTDDYGLFTFEHQMTMECDRLGCRKTICARDFDKLVPTWDSKIIKALKVLQTVEQPIQNFIEDELHQQLLDYLAGKGPYLSVSNQRPDFVTERYSGKNFIA